MGMKEIFQKKKEEVQPRNVAVINPEEVPKALTNEAIEKPKEQQTTKDIPITNLIVSSEALEDGTFRYVMVSNEIYSIGPVEVANK